MVDKATWKFNHTNLRVKDPQRSIKFYEHIGLTLVNKVSVPDEKYDEYFMAYDGPHSASTGANWTDREGVVKLHHDHGTENDDSFTISNGNTEPGRGFGHLCISVDNIQAACKRIEDGGYELKKKLTDGRMRYIAFALDPDGYWIELINQVLITESAKTDKTDLSSYRMNHSMIRIKDPEMSRAFYEGDLGFGFVRVSEAKEAKFNNYFLAYKGDFTPNPNPAVGDPSKGDQPGGVDRWATKEGILEMCWNYGTEKEEGQVYHNGNTDPKGFANISLSVDDLPAACKELEGKSHIKWQEKLQEGSPSRAIILDPDNYWVELIQNQRIKKTAHP